MFFFFLHHNVQELKDAPGPRDLISLGHFQHSLSSQETHLQDCWAFKRDQQDVTDLRTHKILTSSVFQHLSFPAPSFSFPTSQGNVGKLKELHYRLQLNLTLIPQKIFPSLGWGREIIKRSTEFHIVDFLTLFPLQSTSSHPTCRQGDPRGSTLHILMAKAPPNLIIISSHASTANLLTDANGEWLKGKWLYRCLSYISECDRSSMGQRPQDYLMSHKNVRNFSCLYEL